MRMGYSEKNREYYLLASFLRRLEKEWNKNKDADVFYVFEVYSPDEDIFLNINSKINNGNKKFMAKYNNVMHFFHICKKEGRLPRDIYPSTFLKYTMEKHKNDTVNTFDTNISVMCKDILEYLEQEPCEDAISRQAVLDLIPDYDLSMGQVVRGIHDLPSVKPQEPTSEQVEEYCRKRCLTLVSNEFMAHIIADSGESIRTVPSTEPKTGYWIKKKGGNNNYYYECCKCGCLSPCTETADSFLWKLSNFCPDCGANMIETKQSEE